MTRTRIKICSICRPEDAASAASAGADAVGLILHPDAKRYVPPHVARTIIRSLPPFVTPVGVFVDAGFETIRQVANDCRLRHLQLNGSETERDIAALSNYVLVKAVKVSPATFRDDLRHWSDVATRHPHLRALVLDTAGAAPGGTGVENDWSLIADAAAASRLPLIAAGGLTPDNVAAVVRRLRPYAVDVSSGVEESLRVKSPRKITDFVAAVRSADA